MNKLKLLAAFTAISLVSFSLYAHADDSSTKTKSKATATKQAGASQVNISGIQNQYWEAHDKQFEVIQNRLYRKAHRFEIAPLFGLYQRVDFQDTKTLGLSVDYNFTEMWGVELMGYTMFNSDSAVLTRFKQTRNATIEFNKEKYYFGASALFTPIYGKFSFLGHEISHFDTYIAPGVGAVRTIALRPAFSLGVGEKFWLSPKWNLRVEYRWIHYSDRTYTSQGATAVQNGGPGYFDDTVNDQNLLFGVSFLFK